MRKQLARIMEQILLISGTAIYAGLSSHIQKAVMKSGLNDAVSQCIHKFESDMRYRQDRRLIKLFIKYVSKLISFDFIMV